MTERRDLYFAVEGGTTLDLARKYVAERAAVEANNRALAKELGAEQYVISLIDGVLSGVVFAEKQHPDFKRPDRKGLCFPKKGSGWATRLSETKGYDKRGYRLADALGVPTTIDYTYPEGSGSSTISRGWSSGVGFLYLSEDGPFALYIPDISEVVARYEAKGYTVCDECRNFNPVFHGARPILQEEWELVVAHHDLEEAKKRAAA